MRGLRDVEDGENGEDGEGEKNRNLYQLTRNACCSDPAIAMWVTLICHYGEEIPKGTDK